MSNTIKVAAGFSVGNSEVIDDRLVVNTIAERNSILSFYQKFKRRILNSKYSFWY